MSRKADNNLIERAQAARCLSNSMFARDCRDSKEFELEAFMGIFHPEKQADRKYMSKLKRNLI